MKHFNKLMAFFAFMLFSYGVDTLAYTFTFVNKTGRDVKVQLYSAFGKLNKNPSFIKSGGTHSLKFTGWSSGLCLTKVTVSTESSGKWGKQKEAKKKFFRRNGTEITGGSLADLYSGAVPGGWSIVSMCKNKKFILRHDLQGGISAIIETKI